MYQTGLFPELEYSFKHALTHEVTYNGLLRERRRDLHAHIVAAIESFQDDRREAEIDRLAEHALRGELSEKAVYYLRQAGFRAIKRSAFKEAVARFDQALDILNSLPDSQSNLEQAFDIRLDLRPVLNPLGETRKSLERTREAEQIAERLDDNHRRGRVCCFITNSHSLAGDLDEALLSGTRALKLADQLNDLRLKIPTTTHLEQAHYWRGDDERVIELASNNLAALPSEWGHEYFGLAAAPSVWDRCWLAMSLAQLGRLSEASEYELQAVRMAEPMHNLSTMSMAWRASITVNITVGKWAKALTVCEPWIAMLRQGHGNIHLPFAVSSSAWLLARTGEASEAETRIEQGNELLDNHAASGILFTHGWSCLALGHACLLLGRLGDARKFASRAIEPSPSLVAFAPHAIELLGQIATQSDGLEADAGEAHYRKAMSVAEPRGLRPIVAHCNLGLGKTYRRAGRASKLASA